jgi:hypothetical protein
MIAEPYSGTAIGGGGWDLFFLQRDFFPWWDHDNGALRDWDLLFLRQHRSSFGLRQRDLLFNNTHVLHVGDLSSSCIMRIANLSGENGLLRRQRLDSSDGAMARV